ncbi:hypothetical protein [Sphingobium herbicidovorans]|uniref:hypothetical protein n=1 Tax=Sphingobium herbicidovorans TaxID=76947 RepID=UPI0009D9ADBF|nr:hypothetical protein [Sphingobium herbicidovorans]
MQLKSSVIAFCFAICLQNASAQEAQPNIQIIAQAYDRCMATYAVRLTRTTAPDEAIYAEATKSCSPLKDKLVEAIRQQVSPPEADKVLASMDASAKPNFLNMLNRIRSDRAQRESQLGRP